MSHGPSSGEVLITRPRDQADALASKLTQAGLRCHVEPMLCVTPRPVPDWSFMKGAQGLLFTSARAVRAADMALPPEIRSAAMALPVLAVGAATAAAARLAGFQDVAAGGGNVGALAGAAKARFEAGPIFKEGGGAVVHLSGARMAGNLGGELQAAGIQARRVILYDTHPPAGLSPALVDKLRTDAINDAMFFSARTALVFVSLVDQAGLRRQLAGITVYCLSDAVARAASALSWRLLRVALQPTQAALVGLLLDARMHGNDRIKHKAEL
jgi:uroporphyrinogen-III synthase